MTEFIKLRVHKNYSNYCVLWNKLQKIKQVNGINNNFDLLKFRNKVLNKWIRNIQNLLIIDIKIEYLLNLNYSGKYYSPWQNFPLIKGISYSFADSLRIYFSTEKLTNNSIEGTLEKQQNQVEVINSLQLSEQNNENLTTNAEIAFSPFIEEVTNVNSIDFPIMSINNKEEIKKFSFNQQNNQQLINNNILADNNILAKFSNLSTEQEIKQNNNEIELNLFKDEKNNKKSNFIKFDQFNNENNFQLSNEFLNLKKLKNIKEKSSISAQKFNIISNDTTNKYIVPEAERKAQTNNFIGLELNTSANEITWQNKEIKQNIQDTQHESTIQRQEEKAIANSFALNNFQQNIFNKHSNSNQANIENQQNNENLNLLGKYKTQLKHHKIDNDLLLFDSLFKLNKNQSTEHIDHNQMLDESKLSEELQEFNKDNANGKINKFTFGSLSAELNRLFLFNLNEQEKKDLTGQIISLQLGKKFAANFIVKNGFFQEIKQASIPSAILYGDPETILTYADDTLLTEILKDNLLFFNTHSDYYAQFHKLVTSLMWGTIKDYF